DGGLGFLNFPAKDGGTGDPANVVGNPANYWSVSASADEDVQELAIQYLNEFNLNQDMVDDFLAMGAIPAVSGLEDSFGGLEDEGFLSFAYHMVLSAPHSRPSWDEPRAPAPAPERLSNRARIVLGESKPDGCVANLNETLSA